MSVMSKKETYLLTPNGLLGQKITDKIMLYMVKSQVNAIVADEGELHFVKVEKKDAN